MRILLERGEMNAIEIKHNVKNKTTRLLNYPPEIGGLFAYHLKAKA